MAGLNRNFTSRQSWRMDTIIRCPRCPTREIAIWTHNGAQKAPLPVRERERAGLEAKTSLREREIQNSMK
jgi:hypothetical protein